MDLSQLIPRKGLAQQYSPEELLELFKKYVTYMQTDGLIWVYERVKYKDSSKLEPTPKRAPMTTKGFCLYARISHVTFMNYVNPLSTTFKDYNEVAQYIIDYCAVDVFNGSAVGVYNGNLALAVIRRDFGIEDQEDAKGNRHVDTIRHEIAFSDYTDVTNQGALPPSREELEEVIEPHQLQAVEPEPTVQTFPHPPHRSEEDRADSARLAALNAAGAQGRPEEWEYDNVPPYSSRHHNTHQYIQRNGDVNQ